MYKEHFEERTCTPDRSKRRYLETRSKKDVYNPLKFNEYITTNHNRD